MENIINDLNSSINKENNHDIIEHLKSLIEKADSVQIKEINTFIKLFNIDSTDVQTVGSETIAELCKNQENRKIFTNELIVNKLMEFMESGSPELIFTTIRALGNICYENEEASNLVNNVGIESIFKVLRSDSKRQSDSLTVKASGLLVNLLSTHDNLPKTALKGGILSVVEKLLSKYKDPIEDNKVLITFLLSIVNSLTDYLDEKDNILSISKLIIEIFKKTEIPEICILSLEIFHSLSEKDDIKTLLATEGMCELLYDLIEKYRDKVNDEDSRAVLKIACDLIVLILTGDSCMDELYNDGKGKMYCNMLTWLDSDDSDLLSTGILAIGNFARKDTHCIQMVKSGIAKKLIDLLRKYNHSTDINDCKVQHALLSTLKNLVISKENKAQALKDDIIEVMYPMLNQDKSIVVFKLLGTIRMVIDGQPEASLYLLSKKDFIEKLVYWCYNSDHLGIRGEVPRIFSWLIKNSYSSEPFPTFIEVKDSVKCIIDMISSNHGLMQNESFLALNVLAIGLTNKQKHPQADVEEFYQKLCEADLGKNVNFVLNKYGEKWDKHTTENCISFLENLLKSDKVLKELKSNEVPQMLGKLKNNSNATDCLDRLERILKIFNK
ncbi:GTPase-GDP dissociation stimulator vimar [Euwallacea fornicatus]|uniref:GTPase-GDP dissociation stimulator vimar n=1 Tax=Euwallacea fornicatus TaxID=995702 RepID=UPI00338F6C84